MYTWLAEKERVPMVWTITVINKVTVVTCFEDEVLKTQQGNRCFVHEMFH